MTGNAASSGQIETVSLKPGGNAEIISHKLTSVEKDARRLIQQFEEIGFNAKLNSEAIRRDMVPSTNGKDRLNEKDESNMATSYNFSATQEHAKDSHRQLRHSSSMNSGFLKNHCKQVSKTPPIIPVSFGDLVSLDFNSDREVKAVNGSIKKLSSLEHAFKKQIKSNDMDGKAGVHELEQELVKTRNHLAQLEEELHDEKDDKEKAREEAEKLRSLLDNVTSTQTELELKVEGLTSANQKLTRRMSELKDEADRESSLRSCLEESHATLMSRLHDMEGVVDSLRAECKTHQTTSSNMKAEVVKLKEELARETVKRQRIEENYVVMSKEKDTLLLNTNRTQCENQRILHELTCLQTQYADLIRHLDQTQTLADNLAASKKVVEEQRMSLENRVQILTADNEQLKTLYEELKQSESKTTNEKSALNEDLIKQKTEKDKLLKENLEKTQKIDSLKQELSALKQGLAQKNLEFASVADGLEIELSGFKKQLDTMEKEKWRVLKDKESLLEEVHQTVDTLMSERSRLQTELQASCVDTESLKLTCSRLELDKVQLLEKLEGLQHQQTSQRTVEAALQEMMEQKNKLAYENGKLHSMVDQLQQELAEVTKDKMGVIQLRKLAESLQVKYAKSQQEMSEYKIALQKVDGQTRLAAESLLQKDQELKEALTRRDEADKEKEKLLAQLEVLEGRQVYKAALYDKNMEEAKNINREITGTLESIMASHNQLQNVVESLQIELGKRDSLIGQLKSSRKKEQGNMELEMKDYKDEMEGLREELKKEQEKARKKTTKELSEVCRQNENLSSRNQDLVKANSALRQKIAELEKEKNEMKKKLTEQRHKLLYLHKAKKQLEENLSKIKTVRKDIEELDKMREEYMRKNKEQGETIEKFMCQVVSLQDEVRQLVTAYSKTQHLLKLKDAALEKERILEDMRGEYTKCKKREEELCKRSQSTQEKLQEVHSESLEISRHLEEAQDWFRGKLDKLQCELTTSRFFTATS